jgi:hypothetical protein
MKSILLTLFVLNTAMAGFPIVKVIEMSGEYNNKKGTAYAEIADYDLEDVKISHKDIDVKFNKIEKNLILRDDNTSVQLKFDFDFLNVFSALSFEGVDIFSGGNKLDMNFDNLNIFVEEDTYHLNKVDLVSDVTQYNTDGRDISILNGLLLNGEVKMNYLDFGKTKASEINKELAIFNLAQLNAKEEKNKIDIPVIARYLNLNLAKGKFTGSVLLDSWVNAWIRMNGVVKNLEKENKLIITLERAKLGWFSIKGLLLRKVRNLGVESISVEGQNIIINMENVFSRGRNKSS